MNAKQLPSDLTVPLLYQQAKENSPFAWFPTPPRLAEKMVKISKIRPGTIALEPTAGCGCLAEEMRAAGATVDVIEISPILQQILVQKNFNLIGTDFLKEQPRRQYKVIIANPPFSSPQEKGIDTTIIKRAYDLFLQPGGRLISIVSASMFIKNCPKSQSFRALLKKTEAKVIELPIDIFQESPRPVITETWLISIKKKRI